MGLLDKLKGLFSGNKEQVKSGIDKASETAQKAVPDQHDAKVDMAADKAKDVVDDLGGSELDHTAAVDTAADAPRRHRRRRRPPDLPPDATKGRGQAGRAPSSFVSVVAGQLVLDLVDAFFDLAAASSTLPSDLRSLSSVRSPTACLIRPFA